MPEKVLREQVKNRAKVGELRGGGYQMRNGQMGLENFKKKNGQMGPRKMRQKRSEEAREI